MPDFKVSNKDLLVTNSENQAVYAIRKNKEIRDLEGNVVAQFSSKEKRKIGDKKVKVSTFNSENGTFEYVNGQLFSNNELIGDVIKPHTGSIGGSNLSILMLALATLVGTFVFISLIYTPAYSGDVIPVFNVLDSNGVWEEQGTLAVFNSMIYPGAEGAYEFALTNESIDKLLYSFSAEEKYFGELEYNKFMEYRLKMNNKYISNYQDRAPKEWLKGDELIYNDLVFLPNSIQSMTLEWRWPFESGKDESDTLFGIEAGNYSIVLNVKAEVYVE